MSLLTDLTRMWLTRSTRPFTFRNEYDAFLPYDRCDRLGLYVHIPFCQTLCSFCPYCKTVYNAEQCNRYLDALLQEIELVTARHEGRRPVTSLYFGGGTPALAAERIGEIIAALERHFVITDGVGLELHPDNVTVPVLETLRAAGVTKLSIGVQSFQEKYQRILGRRTPDPAGIRAALAAVPFETVSMDFIFALPGQTFEDVRADIATAFQSGANHIALYPFIDFTFTESRVSAMPKREKRELLDKITAYCAGRGYTRQSIWTFAREPSASYSSMTRDTFLGFGCSATTLLRSQFKINTFSVPEYCKRIDAGQLPTALTLRFTRRQRMVYYLFWTAYSTHVDSGAFERFFGESLQSVYGTELALAKKLGWITERNGVYTLTPKGAFYYHYYESFYTLAYIDKMWGIMRSRAFPDSLRL